MAKTGSAKRAEEEVVNLLGQENVKNPKVTDNFICGPGQVYTVQFETQGGELLQHYVHHDGRVYRVYPRSRELVQYLARTARWRNAAIHMFQVAGIAGLIGLIVTITICYLAIVGRPAPQILEHALTAILGFYFATTIYENSKDRSDSSDAKAGA